ncbi:MAG: periplasmic heavy metal sensor [Pseudolabrys sp.]|nr:periplasmic heavy metal sensor [Pseudolabrys sp.]
MSVAQLAPAMTRGSSRWLLLGSLALNLFFIGIAIALAVRTPPPARTWDPNIFVRIERLAAALPPADGAILRGQTKANRDAIDQAQTKYHTNRDLIRESLRQEPFDAQAMRTAMANARAARQAYDQTIQSMFATAAIQMSPAGRRALADWRSSRKSSTSGKR